MVPALGWVTYTAWMHAEKTETEQKMWRRLFCQKLSGQVVMWSAAAAASPPGGAFYSAKNWVGNCPPCPPATYAPDNSCHFVNFLSFATSSFFLSMRKKYLIKS